MPPSHLRRRFQRKGSAARVSKKLPAVDDMATDSAVAQRHSVAAMLMMKSFCHLLQNAGMAAQQASKATRLPASGLSFSERWLITCRSWRVLCKLSAQQPGQASWITPTCAALCKASAGSEESLLCSKACPAEGAFHPLGLQATSCRRGDKASVPNCDPSSARALGPDPKHFSDPQRDRQLGGSPKDGSRRRGSGQQR